MGEQSGPGGRQEGAGSDLEGGPPLPRQSGSHALFVNASLRGASLRFASLRFASLRFALPPLRFAFVSLSLRFELEK